MLSFIWKKISCHFPSINSSRKNEGNILINYKDWWSHKKSKIESVAALNENIYISAD